MNADPPPDARAEADADATPDSSRRPGPLTRFWAREIRGWPPELPLDQDRCRELLDAMATGPISSALEARFAGMGGRLGRFPWRLMVLEIVLVYLPLAILPLTVGLRATLIWLVVALVLEWRLGRTAFRLWFHARLRAMLRGVGVDCCVRCGHLIEGRGPASTCPECGQRHERLPLGWLGDLAQT